MRIMMFLTAWIGVGHGMLVGMEFGCFQGYYCHCSSFVVVLFPLVRCWRVISSVLGFGFYGFLVAIVSFGFPCRRTDF